MTTRARRLLYFGAAVVGLPAIMWFFFGSIGPPPEVGSDAEPAVGAPVGEQDHTPEEPGASLHPSPHPQSAYDSPGDTDVAGPASRTRFVDYAIGLHDLHGLAPDAAPGTRLEVWAAWDPPLVKEPRVQQLVPEVVLKQIIPPTTPEGPHVALISLPARSIPRLLYGDQWGSLSVVMLNGG